MGVIRPRDKWRHRDALIGIVGFVVMITGFYAFAAVADYLGLNRDAGNIVAVLAAASLLLVLGKVWK